MDNTVHNSPETYQNVRDFLTSNFVGTLSTVTHDNKPHATVLYYSLNPDLTLCFLSKKDTQKIKNIEHNNAVVFVVFEASSQTMVQIEGQAHEITDTDEANPVFNNVLKIVQDTSESGMPPISKLFDAGHYVAYKIVPKQIKFGIFNRPDPVNYEMFEILNF